MITAMGGSIRVDSIQKDRLSVTLFRNREKLYAARDPIIRVTAVAMMLIIRLLAKYLR
jgi:hypothetical protein